MSASRTLTTVVFVCLAVSSAFVLFYNAPQRATGCAAYCKQSADASVAAAPVPTTAAPAPVVPAPLPVAKATTAPVSPAPVATPTTENIQVPCTKQCANGSKCVNDVCFCDWEHYGRTCQLNYGPARWARDQEHTNSKLYFTSATAQSRQQLAAVNLFHCPSIIEVGGLMAGTFQHLTRLGWTGNFTQMDMFGPQDANVTRTTLANGEVRVRRVTRSRQLCGENSTEEAAHSCFVFIGIPQYGGMDACAAGVHSAKYQTIVLESPFASVFDVFATKLKNSPQYKSWGIAADWSEDLRRNGIDRKFEPRRFRVFTRVPDV